jgi:hypothetical protein
MLSPWKSIDHITLRRNARGLGISVFLLRKLLVFHHLSARTPLPNYFRRSYSRPGSTLKLGPFSKFFNARLSDEDPLIEILLLPKHHSRLLHLAEARPGYLRRPQLPSTSTPVFWLQYPHSFNLLSRKSTRTRQRTIRGNVGSSGASFCSTPLLNSRHSTVSHLAYVTI